MELFNHPQTAAVVIALRCLRRQGGGARPYLVPKPARRRPRQALNAALWTGLLCLLFGLFGGERPAAAQVIHDDFDSGRFGPQWMPCHRHENEIYIVDVPDQGFRAAKLVIKNILRSTLFGMFLSHDCVPNLTTSPERGVPTRGRSCGKPITSGSNSGPRSGMGSACISTPI